MKTLADRIEPATRRLEAEARERYPGLPPVDSPEKRPRTGGATIKT